MGTPSLKNLIAAGPATPFCLRPASPGSSPPAPRATAIGSASVVSTAPATAATVVVKVGGGHHWHHRWHHRKWVCGWWHHHRHHCYWRYRSEEHTSEPQ